MPPPDRAIIRYLANVMLQDELRVTFVIGSGISAPAGVLTGARLKEQLETEFVDALAMHGAYEAAKATNASYSLDYVISVLVQVLGEDRFLDVIAPYFPTRTRLEVKDKAVAPTFAHEVIAHWVYYGGVDWVIDFNFDDLLVVSLDDELGINAYGVCETALDFTTVADKLTAKGRDGAIDLRSYRLFKPHGTIRLPKSLVKTEEEVERFAKGTTTVLTTALQRSAIVVVIGLSCSEPDFLDLIQTIKGYDAFFLLVDPVPGADERLKSAGLGAEYVRHLKCEETGEFYTAEGFVESVLRALRERQQAGEPPHMCGVFRHELRRVIFEELKVPATLENRLTLAFLMHATKQRGYFNADAFASCHRIANYLADKKLCPVAAAAFEALCKCGTFTRYSGTWYQLTELPESDELAAADRFLDRVQKSLNNAAGVRYGREASRREAIRLFRRLTEECDVEVEASEQGPELPFASARQLRSLVEVVRSSMDIVKTVRVRLSVLSERGWWLLRPPRILEDLRTRGVHVRLLLAGALAPPASQQRDIQRAGLGALRTALGERLHVKGLRSDCGWRVTVNDAEVDGGGLAFRRVNKQVRSTFWLMQAERDVGTLREMFDEWWSRGGDEVMSFEELERVLCG